MSESISSNMAAEHGGGLEESLVAEALGPRRKDVIIASKFGQAELLALKDSYPVFSEDKARQGASAAGSCRPLRKA
jgi:aryl-alcohol dehydrogenase-like predicted oxidoreductase